MARTSTRETLEAMRDAAEEARRVRRQLAQLKASEREGRRVPEPYRASLLHRLDLCETAADRGQAALDAMGSTGTADGWVLDALTLYYADACAWSEVGDAVGYCANHVRLNVDEVLAAVDAIG